MIRGIALTVSFVVAGALPALAQTHPPHPVTHPHQASGHAPMDSAQHAALHAMLLGSWSGTFSSAHGTTHAMSFSVAHDSLRRVSLQMNGDPAMHVGGASDFILDGHELHWTQDLSGKACKATALLDDPKAADPEIKGKMTCEHDQHTFTLHKKTG